MHNLLRCRRGSAAFATVVALVPLIGVVGLGAEAGSWYVTKQHAQNAADAAAYSGGLQLACSNVASCTDTQTVAYRGKEFAAQNAFCNAGDTSYPGSQCVTTLPTGTSQAVQINTLTAWNGVNGNFVQATVSQQQPKYLVGVLPGMSSSPVTIGATAIAQVNSLPTPACALALTGSISFQGSPNINAPGCSMASNDTAQNALVQLSGSYDSALCGGMKVRRMRIACGNKTRESNRG
jgi:Flp pilus assembly protein TadG